MIFGLGTKNHDIQIVIKNGHVYNKDIYREGLFCFELSPQFLSSTVSIHDTDDESSNCQNQSLKVCQIRVY